MPLLIVVRASPGDQNGHCDTGGGPHANRARSARAWRTRRRGRRVGRSGQRFTARPWTKSRRSPNRSTPLVHFGWSDLRAVRDGRWKYILAPRPELYDLETDPGERDNLVEREAQRARALPERHRTAAARGAGAAGTEAPAATASVPPDLLEKLGALGYVSTASAAARPRRPAPTRKTRSTSTRSVNTLMREGLVSLREGRFADSLAAFRRSSSRGTDSFEAHYYAARALDGAETLSRSGASISKAPGQAAAYSAAYVGLADAHLAGENDLALAADAVPGSEGLAARSPADRTRGRHHAPAGRRRAGACSDTKVASLAPDDALIRVKLGELHPGSRTSRTMRLACCARPSSWTRPPRRTGIRSGWCSAATATCRPRNRRFARPPAARPRNAQYHYNLGLALARQNSATRRRPPSAACSNSILVSAPRGTSRRAAVVARRVLLLTAVAIAIAATYQPVAAFNS